MWPTEVSINYTSLGKFSGEIQCKMVEFNYNK